MIKGLKVFDCSIREIGYQTGWHFDPEVVRNVYKFAQGKGIDYVELGFFHDEKADPGRGCFRYCSLRNDEISDMFHNIKNFTKLSAMRDIQRPLSPLLSRDKSPIDTIRILTRSHETQLDILEPFVDEAKDLGYEVFINFTSAGYNSNDLNKRFIDFAAKKEVEAIEFADTESVMTTFYVEDTIKACHEATVKCGIHVHDKNGTADILADKAIECGAEYMDVTHLGLGGKWRDGNLTLEYLLRKLYVPGSYESTVIKNEIINQLIKYHDMSVAD